jgi:YHS domain-containing protein
MEVEKMIVDPVCGTDLEHFEYPEREDFNGYTFFFGSLGCAQKFREDPAKYVAGREAEFGEKIPDYVENA